MSHVVYSGELFVCIVYILSKFCFALCKHVMSYIYELFMYPSLCLNRELYYELLDVINVEQSNVSDKTADYCSN